MTMRKLLISFCKNIEGSVRILKVWNEINKRAGWNFLKWVILMSRLLER